MEQNPPDPDRPAAPDPNAEPADRAATPQPDFTAVNPDGRKRWETGDWDWDPKEDPDWDDPKIPRLRLRDDEYEQVADAVVREQRLVIDGHRVVGKRARSGGEVQVQFCLLELRPLYDAVAAHPLVRLAQTKEEPDGFLRPDRVIDARGIPTNEPPTRLGLHGCVVESCVFSYVDIGCRLTAAARFAAAAVFDRARFAADARFDSARFAPDARFDHARFVAGAVFNAAQFDAVACFIKACFAADAGFDGARFAGDAQFVGSRFAADSQFERARFDADAHFGMSRFDAVAGFEHAHFAAAAGFEEARFAAVARFDRARFAAAPWFAGARFDAGAWFDGARFDAGAGFVGARFAADARFDGARFDASAHFRYARFEFDPDGDLRMADVREVQPRRSGRSGAWFPRSWPVGWTLLRAIGELSVITRVSVLALILVPPLASAWPAVRAGIVGYNEAVADAAARFDAAADRLRAATEESGNPGALQAHADRFAESIDAWTDRFGGMEIDGSDMPPTLAWAFFAAALITIAQVIYQMRAPPLIRKYDEDAFVEWMHQRYPEDAKDRDDGLRRACDSLRAIAARRTDRLETLVRHHGETVWIPPKEKIEWFGDIELVSRAEADTWNSEQWANVGAHHVGASYPQGYLPAAERARIAIEEGAKAEYWVTSREHLKAAWACLVLYGFGVAMLLIILFIQARNVGEAAGFW